MGGTVGPYPPRDSYAWLISKAKRSDDAGLNSDCFWKQPKTSMTEMEATWLLRSATPDDSFECTHLTSWLIHYNTMASLVWHWCKDKGPGSNHAIVFTGCYVAFLYRFSRLDHITVLERNLTLCTTSPGAPTGMSWDFNAAMIAIINATAMTANNPEQQALLADFTAFDAPVLAGWLHSCYRFPSYLSSWLWCTALAFVVVFALSHSRSLPSLEWGNLAQLWLHTLKKQATSNLWTLKTSQWACPLKHWKRLSMKETTLLRPTTSLNLQVDCAHT